MIEITMRVQDGLDLFDRFDPSPTESRRLSGDAVAYLLASLKSATEPGPVRVTLRLSESQSPRDPVVEAALTKAIPGHFRRLVDVASDDIGRLRLIARIFIPIGFFIMCVCMVASELLTGASERHVVHSLGEGILVLGWVALWAPFDHLLFGRFPLMRERSYYRQLANAQVQIQHGA